MSGRQVGGLSRGYVHGLMPIQITLAVERLARQWRQSTAAKWLRGQVSAVCLVYRDSL